jgi:hypothetical protein
MSIVFLVDENPNVASAGLGGGAFNYFDEQILEFPRKDIPLRQQRPLIFSPYESRTPTNEASMLPGNCESGQIVELMGEVQKFNKA